MNKQLIGQDEWEELLDKAISGRLTESKAKELNTLLKSEQSRIDDYIRYVDMHGSLYQEPLLAVAGGADTMVDFETIKSVEARKETVRFWKRFAAAASIAALVALSLNLWQVLPGSNSEGFERADYIGIMTGLKNGGDNEKHFVGQGLQRGPFRLESGKAQVRLDNGVELSIRGPVEFDVFGLDHIAMVTGRMTAKVPPQAIGFRIDTPDMEVVDLGTEFALKVDSFGKSRLHVLEGEVEARLKEGLNNENYPLIIAKDRLEELDRSPSYLEKVYDPVSFAPSPVRDELILATGGMVHSLQDAPRDLRHGRFKHDYIMLFPERLDYELSESLPVNLTEPGTYRFISKSAIENYLKTATDKQKNREKLVESSLVQGEIPASTKVNSYLVHFDASEKRGKIHKARGRIRFSKRILGVILHGPDLNDSDVLVGNPSTVYENNTGRRTEDDVVRISSDRHQVFLQFKVNGFIDQARIIVEADIDPSELALND